MAPTKSKPTRKKSTAKKSTARKGAGCTQSNVGAFETGYKAGLRHGRQGY
jgi:hypothetical protein